MAVDWMTFHITDRCQLDCDHCLRDPEQKPKDLPVALVRRVLGEAKRLYRTTHAAFSGGEPTLHPDFEGIVDAAVDNGFTWHMVSNGRRFAQVVEKLRARPERLAANTSVTFSLDGATEETHDSIREAGSYREVMSAASAATAFGIPFVLQMTLHARNQHEVEAMGLLASQLGAARLSFGMALPTGTHHDRGMYLSSREWRRVMDRIDRLQAALTIPISTPEGFYREQPFHVCAAFMQQQVHVDIEGRVNLCCMHSGIPSEKPEFSDVAADLGEVSLAEAHMSLIGVIHKAQTQRAAEIASGDDDEWSHFPCNACMRSFGKPHWTDEGVGGPAAVRERWRGAWAKTSLPIVR
jgi:MoaA/NifB/PqqE/SkfB family radical SAM enzyme